MTLLLGGPLTGKSTRLVEAYRQHLAAGRSPREILCLSFFPANANLLRRELRPQAGDFLPWVTTLQRFETLLLRQYHRHARLPRRVREIPAASRVLILRQAWEQSGGDLWRAYGESPGALAEFARVADWLSAHRAGFAVRPAELGDHELVRAYAAYIALCERHQLLTFQEASLRCLDLLALPEIAADVRRRFPILLVDDVHLARPDQLRLLDRLRPLAAETLITAWLDPPHHAPELQTAWETLQAWGPVEHLAPPPAVNPAVREVGVRVTVPPGPSSHSAALDGTGRISIVQASTVEDEARAAADAIAQMLAADPALAHEDVAVIAPEDVLRFAERVLAGRGLPVAPRPMPAGHTPLIRAARLAVRWARHPRQRVDIEPQLLDLPLVALDPLDRHALLRAAALHDKPPLSLAADQHAVKLSAPARAALVQLAESLSALDPAQPISTLADAALAALNAPAWLQTDQVFTPAERTGWEQAFADWRRLVRELEAFIARGLPAPDDWEAHLDELAEQVGHGAANGGLRLVPLHLVNGVRARHAFVLGLSESAAPRRPPEMQLVAEAQLPDLLAAPPPLARHHRAWIEREARALAAALTRGVETLWISTSRHAATGDAQLPSPFFERLLGQDGAIDREGGLVLNSKRGEGTTQDEGRKTKEGRLPRAEVGGGPEADDGRAQEESGDGEAPFMEHAPRIAPREPPARTLAYASASQLRAYLTCPLQYYYQRILGLETEGSAALDRGGLIHELLCVAAGDGGTRAVQLWDRPRPAWLNSSASLNERALAALEAAWRGEAVNLPGGGAYTPAFPWGPRFGPELQRQAVRRWVERMLALWADYETGALAGPRRPVLLETEFEFELGPYRLRGRIDRIDEVQTENGPEYEVLDYKTGASYTVSRVMSAFLPPEGEPPSDFQLPIYALALMRGNVLRTPAAPRCLHLLHLENMEPGKRGFSATARRTVELTPAGEVDAKQGFVPVDTLNETVVPAIRSTLDRMARPPWPAQPGRHCENCSFRAACDRGQEAEAA